MFKMFKHLIAMLELLGHSIANAIFGVLVRLMAISSELIYFKTMLEMWDHLMVMLEVLSHLMVMMEVLARTMVKTMVDELTLSIIMLELLAETTLLLDVLIHQMTNDH